MRERTRDLGYHVRQNGYIVGGMTQCLLAHEGAEMTAAVEDRQSWAEYVADILSGVPRDVVARAAGIHPSGIGRWLRSQNRPSAEKVVDFARGIDRPPVEALVAAGYLEPEEAAAVIEVHQSRKNLTDEELLTELGDRLLGRESRPKIVDDITLRLAPPDDEVESGQDD